MGYLSAHWPKPPSRQDQFGYRVFGYDAAISAPIGRDSRGLTPTQVRIYGDEEHEMEIGHFFSDEPGYYQDNEWGIRLETILTVVPLDTKYTFDKRMLGFEAVTLVPFETKLINLTLLDDYQCHWLNAYHQRVKEHVGPELLAQNRGKAYDWMLTKIQPLPCPNPDRLQQDRPHISPPAKATTTTSTTTTTTSTTSASTTTTTTTRQGFF
ncbi:Xaa-Pro aminopeptidase 1 [Portunus trituberculatus]|uniref:Xaa-Pro aminopeptidase 1 n=1 Tax=Portunus trituberculatus TaxID=210409 RepID=A0A5B7E1L8_PORTR|nr:Xaa-Pro aminopeptidase 1 [Portunus trituberculatus]